MTSVLLSGFADESTADKNIDQQFATMAALGLEYLSIRFVNIGDGVQNVLTLNETGFEQVRNRMSEFGVRISSIGSPIGKVNIADVDDGSGNRFVPFEEYLESDVMAAIRAAAALETRLIRGFSFYHPRGESHEDWLGQAVDQIGSIVERCDQHGLTFGLEVEANLIGHTGSILRKIHEQVNHPGLVLVFDGANLVTQGFSAEEILSQFREMLPGLGWFHVKDYISSAVQATGSDRYVDEEALDSFVPADQGNTGHASLFAELAGSLDDILKRLHQRNVPGFFLDLEPHLRGGGQFGGFSGPDGMGIALRSLCQVLDSSPLQYRLKSFSDLRK